jgi:SPP1 family predicted phage head-tail adaptor
MTVAGELRERVTIQTQAAGAADTYGQPTVVWADVATVWANVIQIASTEQFEGDQLMVKAAYRINMRRRSDLTTKHRLVWGDKYLTIASVLDSRVAVETVVTCWERS